MGYVNRLVAIENDLAAVGHVVDEKERKRALLRGLRQDFATTAKVIRLMDMSFTKAVSELVVEEGASVAEHSVSIATGFDTALTAAQSGRHS